jgi:hypothetical protein
MRAVHKDFLNRHARRTEFFDERSEFLMQCTKAR